LTSPASSVPSFSNWITGTGSSGLQARVLAARSTGT
jgi:hypothetical protein